MIKIPNENKRFSQTNASDVSGNIWISKNLNFDEAGKISLSPRSVMLKSEEVDSNFDLVTSLGFGSSLSYLATTTDQPYTVDLGSSVTEDTGTGNPSLYVGTHGVWFQDRWHASALTKIHWRTFASSTWTDTGVTLTGGASSPAHPLCVFKNRNTLCAGDVNYVRQYNTSYATTTDLALPAGTQVVGLAYNNHQMGIITKQDNSVNYTEEEAFFYVWDGATTSANGGWGIGSTIAVAICPYKSSFVILTGAGQLLYFTGNGFQLLANFPFFYRDTEWIDANGNMKARGFIMTSIGDTILINIDSGLNTFGKYREHSLPEFPAGAWCYDPEVGLYHKYSPSISAVAYIDTTGVDATTNIFTNGTTNTPPTGSPIYLWNSAGTIGGIDYFKIYYVINLSSTTFKLATTKAFADAGTAIDITAGGTFASNFLSMTLTDFGQTSTDGNSGVIRPLNTIDEEFEGVIMSHTLPGVTTSTSDYGVLCATVPRFENRGYFVTPKIEAPKVEDTQKKIYIKFQRLIDDNQIIVKYRNRNIDGLPISFSNAYTGSNVRGTWTNTTTFTCTGYLSEVKTAFDAGVAIECEILSGSGGGQMPQVSNITYDTGTYTVTLDEAVLGATATEVFEFRMDNWTKARTLTASSQDNQKGFSEIPVGKVSKWIQVKVELRGYKTTFEELQIINETFKPSA